MAVSADLPDLERALAQAFLHDPMISWVDGGNDDDGRLRRTAESFFRHSLVAGLRRGHTYLERDGDGVVTGGAIWSPPDVHMLTEAEGTALGMAVMEQSGPAAIERLITLGELVRVHHPEGRPHFYLFVVGATAHGRGVGARVLAPVLDRCDADALPAYLESSSARNLAFYERLGFEVCWEARPTDDGPVMRGLWREPR